MTAIANARIAILATDGFEKSELFEPHRQLKDAGAEVTVVSLKPGEIKSWDNKDWGEPIAVDRTLGEVSADDFDALVLPGGQMNPDILRAEPAAVDFVRAVHERGKIVAAICHAPWLLIEAKVISGRRATSYGSIRTDMENAGARFEDSEVVVDGNLITSRKPDDIDAFVKAIIKAVEA